MADAAQGDQNIHAEDNSIAFGGISVGGNVGDIRIGHTIGYTSEQVSTLITQISTTFQPKPFDGRSPYKGLDVFEEEDSEMFFGREKLVQDLIVRVKESRTLFVTGPSGSGKSSLARAGLIHALKQGTIPGSERWLYATLKPGRDPFESMAGAFSRLKSPELGDYFLQNVSRSEALHKCAESVLSERSDQRLVLFIDQFEEIFTQIHKEKAQAFVEQLAHAAEAEHGRVILLFAMRSDFIPNCVVFPKLNALLNKQFVQIGAMQGDELVSAIAQPALRVGLRIDPDLIAQIINDMHGEPGALPLMQFALKDLFDSQQAKGGLIALTLSDYLARGGIRKALERHADNSFARLNGHERKLTRLIFSSLIEIGRGTVDTRRTAVFDELVPASARSEEVEAIVRKLADARLLTTDEVAGKDTVTISHEKLIDAWPWLKKLVNDNRDVIAAQNEIAKDAKEWEDHGRDPSYLYSGARLGVAQEQLAANKVVLSGLSKEFLDEGIALREAERKAKESLRRRIITGLTAGIAVALVLAAFAVYQMFQAREQATIALARQLASKAQLLNNQDDSKQMLASLLSIQSMKLYANGDAASFLLNNNYAAQLVAEMKPGGRISSVMFSPNGNYIASVGWSEGQLADIRIWETESGRELNRLTGAYSSNISFSPGWEHIVYYICAEVDETSNCVDFSIQIADVRTGKKIVNIPYDGYQPSSLTFSGDGKYIASSGCDEVDPQDNCAQSYILVSDALTGLDVLRLRGKAYPFPYQFSPNGKYIASADCDQLDEDTGSCSEQNRSIIRVQEIITGKEVAILTFDGVVYSRLAFSPDSQSLAIGHPDRSIRLWNIADNQEIAQKTFDSEIGTVAFSPDGQYIAADSRLWEIATGDVTGPDLRSVPTFSPDSKYSLLQPGNGLVLWDIIANKELLNIPSREGIVSFAFSPNGNYVVATSMKGIVRVWESATGLEVARMTHEREVYSAAFSPDGNHVLSGSYDGTIRLWKAAMNREVLQVPDDNKLIGVIQNKYLVSTRCDEYSTDGICKKITTISTVEIPGGREVQTTFEKAISEWNEMDYEVSAIETLSPDGTYLAAIECVHVEEDPSSCLQKIVHIWDTTTGKKAAQKSFPNINTDLAFSPDSQSMITATCEESDEYGCAKSSLFLWEVKTGRDIAHVTVKADLGDSTFSPDGRYIISHVYEPASDKAFILVWNALTLQHVSRFNSSGVHVGVSPDGKYLLLWDGGITITAWDIAKGEKISHMTHDKVTNINPFSEIVAVSVAFNPYSKYVVTGSRDQTARVWKVTNGNEVARVTHENPVSHVAMSSDGKFVVSASTDGVIRVWDAFTGQEYARRNIKVCDTCFPKINFLSFSFDGKHVISNEFVWMWQREDIIANACAYLPRSLTRAEWAQDIGDALPYQAVCENLPIEPEVSSTPTVSSEE